MIVVSAGLQKSGTGWYFNLTNDLLVATGYQDVRTIRDKFHLGSILKHGNCLISDPNLAKLIPLMVPNLLGNTFVVKTHSKPSPALKQLMQWGIVKATYIYRDPRDVVLSALDHGEKARSLGKTEVVFAGFENVKVAARNTARWLSTWESWVECPNVLTVRYEDLQANPVAEMKRLAEFIALDVSLETLDGIVRRYQPDAPDFNSGTMHYNKGIVGRYKEVMSADELEICDKFFGKYLTRMGYSS